MNVFHPMVFEPAAVDLADPRPLVLLDVDGVLVPTPYRAAQAAGERTIHMARISARTPVRFTDGLGNDGSLAEYVEREGGRIACFAAGVFELIEALDGRARMVWATSWERMAHDELAPTLTRGHDWPYISSRVGGDWKWQAVRQIPDEVPLVWVDDDAIPRAADAWARRRSAPTLLIRPNPRLGLRPAQQLRIQRFVQQVEFETR